jgi:diaminohydroxyphosphoribosylaminopyrimidine deaminase/5-amino-6-(5-phosphoribosylamino)uracil reductase
MMSTAAAVAAQPERAAALEAAGAEIETIDEREEPLLQSALERLGARGVTSIVVEGGPTLHRSFWQAGLVDAVQLFIGPGAAPAGTDALGWLDAHELPVSALVPVSIRQLGPDVRVEYVHRSD